MGNCHVRSVLITITLALLIAVGLVAAFNPGLSASGVDPVHMPGVSPRTAPVYVPGEILVKFKPGLSDWLKSTVTAVSGCLSTLREIGPRESRKDIQLVKLRQGVSVEEAVSRLRLMSEVVYAEPNYYCPVEPLYTPDDPEFLNQNQWGLHNTGQEVNGITGTPDADIDAPAAWDIEKGLSNPVTVAVPDSGIDFTHDEFTSKLWVNEDEIPGDGIDNDANGYIDDINGYNFAGICQRHFYYLDDEGVPEWWVWPVGETDDTTKFAQSIKGTGQKLTEIGIQVAQKGDPLYKLNIYIRETLDGANLASSFVNGSSVTTYAANILDVNHFYGSLSSEVPLVSGTTYYIVYEAESVDPDKYFLLCEYVPKGTENQYVEGNQHRWDETSTSWVEYPTYDFYFETNPNAYPRDDRGHGTGVSGVIAAATDNGQGMAGVSHGAKLMPLKYMAGDGSSTTANVVDALHYAADNGADVMNMSFGGYEVYDSIRDAVSYAYGKGMTMVAGAGNRNNTDIGYPAGYPNVIGVGATTSQDKRASFPTWGSNYNSSVDVAAPGHNVLSTMPMYQVVENTLGYAVEYDYQPGTSISCPWVSGLAALVLSRKPSYTQYQVEKAIEFNADDLGDPGRDDQYGYGRINARRTLSNLDAPEIAGISRTSGERESELTITGDNFAGMRGTSKVTFGGVEVSNYTCWSEGEVKCKVPSNASYGQAAVKVQTYAGTSNGMDFTVEFNTPTVTGITPDSGTNDGTASITNLKGTGFRTGAKAYLIGPSGSGEAGGGTITATDVNVASSSKITCSFELNGATAGSYTVKITNTDGKSGQLAGAFTVNEVTTPTWYLAEGTTAWGFDCYISIENPNSEAVSATVTYMTDAGAVPGGDIDLPGGSQATVNPEGILGEKDFSTRVECTDGKTIAVDRTMTWTGPGAPSPDGHCSIGVTAPATTWYLPEGSSAWGFDCWLLVQNPNEGEATAQVTYMIEGADPVIVEKKIPENSRKTYNMANDIGNKDASIKVEADIPVIPERAMYKNNNREGHDSIGTTTPATSYYLAEGTTAWGFTTYVLIQNPSANQATVEVTYLTSSGEVPHPENPITMNGNSRKTIRVNDYLPGSDFSTRVTGSQAIIAERAMYWGEDTALGEACHDSIGMSAPHTTFYLPDGQTSEGRETYTLVANPNDTDVTVEITYLTPDGTGNVTFSETVAANTRMTYSMADKGIGGRASVMVTSRTAGKKIMVERAMYWNTRGAGTDTIGGYGD